MRPQGSVESGPKTLMSGWSNTPPSNIQKSPGFLFAIVSDTVSLRRRLDDLEVAVPNDHSLNDIQSIGEAFETLATRLDDLKVYHASNRAGSEIDARIDRARRLALRAAALARQLHS